VRAAHSEGDARIARASYNANKRAQEKIASARQVALECVGREEALPILCHIREGNREQ